MTVRLGPDSPLLVMLVPTEHEEQVALFDWADVMKAKHPELDEMFAVPNFAGRLGKLTARHGAELKAEGRKPGVEDVMLLVARGGYHGLLMELKRVNATDSDVKPAQRAWHKIHVKRGFRVEVCKGAEAAKAVLLWYLSLPVTRVVAA